MKILLAAAVCIAVLGGLALNTFRPAVAGEVPPPPPLAKSERYLTNTLSVTLNAPLPEARQFMRDNPLTGFLQPSGRIPRVESVDVLSGDWGEPGSLRQVNLAGGHWTHERVLTSDDDEFTYQIWNISTAAGRFIDHIHGQLRFTPEGDKTRLTWSYGIKPKAFFARPSIRTFLEEDFSPFMQGALSAFAQAHNGN